MTKRVLTDDEADLVRAAYTENRRLKQRQAAIDMQIMDLLTERAAVTREMRKCDMGALAEKFSVCRGTIFNACRSRGARGEIRA